MKRRAATILISGFCLMSLLAHGQTQSVARQWNEVMLEAIRNDFARPTVHARNLFHVSAAMYDAWAVFDDQASPYFLGKSVGGFLIPFQGFSFTPDQKNAFQREAISYAAYTLMNHRFGESPDFAESKILMDALMQDLGYDLTYTATDYSQGSAAALGNYIAEQIKLFGYQDGANERGNYGNLFYQPVNEPLDLFAGGDNEMENPNRWQPLQFGDEPMIDQSGNIIIGGVVDFLGPEWGEVRPFAMDESDMTELSRDGSVYHIYKNPGPPPALDVTGESSWEDMYKWNFALVAVWSGQLDPHDNVMWDISPGGIGALSLEELPRDFNEYPDFYDLVNGGDPGTGFDLNPRTGEPYASQIVPRGDYARVLAEFWADGPDSETPPGHWFVILNYVMDHSEFDRKFEGEGNVLGDLEYDIKAYFILGGAMHDAAIAAWSIKGYYDYIRPVSAIRYMATKGQSTDPDAPNYDPSGLPLLEGYIELIGENDPLVGENNENLNEIKIKAWKGHNYIENPETDEAGAGWISAREWWPYQRPSFVTPPFAGYVSGHSTYSRAAAEVLTMLTGDEYFPGGLGEFEAPANEFLVFEDGPFVDVKLQWARYRDASDQCSLSRIWGGIHPPADDINGRIMGESIGRKAFQFGSEYFGLITGVDYYTDKEEVMAYPNPANHYLTIKTTRHIHAQELKLMDLSGRLVNVEKASRTPGEYTLDLSSLKPGLYLLKINRDTLIKVLVSHD